MFSVSTILGEKASDVEQPPRSRCQVSWPSPTNTLDRKKTSKRRHRVCESNVLLFSFDLECTWVDGNGCVNGCLYDAILVRILWTVEKDV